MNATDPIKYPIGLYKPEPYTEERKHQWLQDIRRLPAELHEAIEGLTPEQLQTPYREGGWKLIQIVHHVADANINGYIRCKFAYTEEEPLVRPFLQDRWSCTPEVEDIPAAVSLRILEALHVRWYGFLLLLSRSDWDRKVIHPDYNEKLSLWRLLGLYSWHPRHHVSQILAFRQRMGW